LTITDRLDAALAKLEKQWSGKRRPKAVYLNSGDWEEFMATKPSTAFFSFGNNPPVMREEPTFRDLPVRESKTKAGASRLYDQTATGRVIR
jgi:hypothetical protein